MDAPFGKGNDPKRWDALLEYLDEKLQLGLLDNLRKVSAYHFEDKVLYLECSTPEVEKYLGKDSVLQQLTVIAQDVCNVDEVKIKKE